MKKEYNSPICEELNVSSRELICGLTFSFGDGDPDEGINAKEQTLASNAEGENEEEEEEEEEIDPWSTFHFSIWDE